MHPDKAALLSVTDKSGLEELAQALSGAGFRLIASSGTAAAVRSFGLPCEEVESLTDYPALFGGRVKTLHPKVFGGILARPDRAADVAELRQHEIPALSVIVVNLYRFVQVAGRNGLSESEAIENIDIGGVSLLRAGAKNYEWVSVLSQPAQYAEFIASLAQGGPSLEQRRRWAALAFSSVARYDAAIAAYFAHNDKAALPDVLSLDLPLRSRLRYGENPWAKAAFYHSGAFPEQLSGKTLSYNNLLDVDSCLRLIAPISEPLGFPAATPTAGRVVAAIVKHTIPCGLAAADEPQAALEAALGADPISAFGGIVAVSDRIDLPCAQLLHSRFLEVVAAPAFDEEAQALLITKKNLRLLRFDANLPAQLRAATTVRSALGGVLAEEPDPAAAPDEWKLVTDKHPEPALWRDLLFAFGAVRQVKSNAAVVARNQVTLGICGGQTNRVAAVELACRRAGSAVRGAVLATDGFFPFADGVEAAINAGIDAVVAPSGSIRDSEVIAAAQRGNIALVFTSRRYFLH